MRIKKLYGRLISLFLAAAAMLSLGVPVMAEETEPMEPSTAGTVTIYMEAVEVSASSVDQTVYMHVYADKNVGMNTLTSGYQSSDTGKATLSPAIPLEGMTGTITANAIQAKNATQTIYPSYDPGAGKYLLFILPITVKGGTEPGTVTINFSRFAIIKSNSYYTLAGDAEGSTFVSRKFLTTTGTVTITEASTPVTINFVAVNPNDSNDETDDSETYSEDMPIPDVMPRYEYYNREWVIGSEGDQFSLTQENGEWSVSVPEGEEPITIPEGSTEQEALDAVLAAYIASHPEAEAIEVDAVYTRQTYQVTLNANVKGTETSIYTTDSYEAGHSVRLVAPATYGGEAFGYWVVKDVPYYDANGELAYKDMQYDSREMTFVSIAPSRDGEPFAAYAYYGVESQSEFPLSLRIANQYGEIASGNHKIVMTLELAAPEKVTAVGFLYTTDQDAMEEGPILGVWNTKTSSTVAKKGTGTYTLRLNVGQATDKEVAACAYVIYKGQTYYASTWGMAAEGEQADCYDVLTWDALAN